MIKALLKLILTAQLMCLKWGKIFKCLIPISKRFIKPWLGFTLKILKCRSVSLRALWLGTEFVYYLKGCDFIKQCMNAKEYDKVCGLPVETIRKLCRTNVLRYVQRGKVYLVNIACGDVYFEAD